MLPDYRFEHDEKWIREQINKIPNPEWRLNACIGYSDAYQQALENEPVEHKKINAGRRAANNRLRLFVIKCTNYQWTGKQ